MASNEQATTVCDVSGWLLVSGDVVPPHDLWLSTREQAILAGLQVPKRRQDWRLGRWAAKRLAVQLLQRRVEGPGEGGTVACPSDVCLSFTAPVHPAWGEAYGLEPARLSVLAASDGAPELYLDELRLPLQLSLSHTSGWAVALLGPLAGPAGIDLEVIEARSPAFMHDYLDITEQSWAQQQPDPDLAGTLLWSAKESVLKARRTGLREDPRGVQVRMMPLPPVLKRQLTVQPCPSVLVRPPEPAGGWWAYHAASRQVYVGEWYSLDGKVLTLVLGSGPIRNP